MRAVAVAMLIVFASAPSSFGDEAPGAQPGNGSSSQSMQELNATVAAQCLRCWKPAAGALAHDSTGEYIPQVRVSFDADGSLSGRPVLVNPPSDAGFVPIAKSALRAVLKCGPLKIPAKFADLWERGRVKTIDFVPMTRIDPRGAPKDF